MILKFRFLIPVFLLFVKNYILSSFISFSFHLFHLRRFTRKAVFFETRKSYLISCVGVRTSGQKSRSERDSTWSRALKIYLPEPCSDHGEGAFELPLIF